MMALAAKSPRPKKCRHCREQFAPSKPLQVACSVPCALSLTKAKQEMERKALATMERKEIRAAKQRLKTKADHMREAQVEFNAWVRQRDRDLPCISCDKTDAEVKAQAVGGTWDAGHYRSTGSCPELRFEPLNTHRQCKRCNRDLSGNAVEYRIRLVQRIGADRLAWLEGPHEPKRYTIEELKAIKAEYRGKLRELKKGEIA